MRTLAAELKFSEADALDFFQIKRLLNGRVSGLKVKYIDLETVRGAYKLSTFLPPGYNAFALSFL